MDDSDQDFADLCSRLLKRKVRKKAGDSGEEKEPETQCPPQNPLPVKRRRRKDDVVTTGSADREVEQERTVADIVCSKMQQFRWLSPQRLQRQDPTALTPDPYPASVLQRREEPTGDTGGDEELALRLQRELDSEADESGGPFLCQLCQRDLSAMTPQLRAQHINRCLDESEGSGIPAPHSRPVVHECPICGKSFKSLKSRAKHVKQCSAEMGVPTAVLLQALQKQTPEVTGEGATDPQTQAKGQKKNNKKKKHGRKAEPLDEDTMVALALSRSLVEQERKERGGLFEGTDLQPDAGPALQAKSVPGKGKKRTKKGAVDVPPPLLLRQSLEEALRRQQERVALILLCPRAPTPPANIILATNALLPSSAGSDAAPLWHKTALPAADAHNMHEFYAPELQAFIQPWVNTLNAPLPCAVQSPATLRFDSPFLPPTSSLSDCGSEPQLQTCSQSSSTTVQGSQRLSNVLEAADRGPPVGESDGAPEQHSFSLSGFIAAPSKPKKHAESFKSLSRLSADLGSMANNPQLSDVQLQVDSGDVFFAHSFILYSRCPLLAELVHTSGFGVQEDGMPSAQRVLMGNVPSDALLALLQYLYTSHCLLTPTLAPILQDLATRFCLDELQEQCELYIRGEETEDMNQEDEAWDEEEEQNDAQAEQNFLKLLRSMWNHEEDTDDSDEEESERREQNEGMKEDGHEGEGKGKEDHVDEEELEEIYEFAATQKRSEPEDQETYSKNEEDNCDEETPDCPTVADICDCGPEESSAEEIPDCPTVADRHDSRRSETRTEELGEGHISPHLEVAATPNRGYSWLFSQSYGEFKEPSQIANAGSPRGSPTHPTSKHLRPQQDAVLQAVEDETIDLSISPPLLPEVSVDVYFPQTKDLQVKGLATGKRTCTTGQQFMVISDSSDEENVAPDDRCVLQQPSSLQAFTSIRDSEDAKGFNTLKGMSQLSQSDSKTTTPRVQTVHVESPSTSLWFEESRDHSGQLDTSDKVSWLIPATPVLSNKSGTIQTSLAADHQSMRRKQLFTMSSSSSSSSSVPGALKSNSCLLRTSPCQSDMALNHKAACSLTQSRIARTLGVDSSAHLTPSRMVHLGGTIHHFSQPTSSTPLHSGSEASLSCPLGSSHFSKAERSSSSASSPERTGTQELEGFSRTSSKSLDLQTEKTERIEQMEGEKRSLFDKSKTKSSTDEEEAEDFPQQSVCFYDEPPMAFNDSWGLDAPCQEVEERLHFTLNVSGHSSPSPSSPPSHTNPAHPSPQTATKDPSGQLSSSLLNSKIWNDWEEEEEASAPLSQRLQQVAPAKRVAQLRTPVASHRKDLGPLVSITPMPNYSVMETPELKNRLNRFGVRPLPKRQMVLKLKEIHQYTHQVLTSDSEEEEAAATLGCSALPLSPTRPQLLKQPQAPSATSSQGQGLGQGDTETLSVSQGSSTSDDTQRSNPELPLTEDSSGDEEGITLSQAATRHADKLKAVRSFILSDPELYGRVLQYRPLVLSQLQAQLKAAGIRLGAAKLLDFLDSQCITFTTARAGQSAPVRRRGAGTNRPAKGATRGRGRRKAAAQNP
ncbi:structure-specific endonuclease subunit SLX4 [Denticeps clupeoides]|uniref:Structure-specific endonuclease subunit SLX4 n=1 Tax=Denticeps clupeoides TaxID=299321 RepID=A0AAY4DWP3_9TELE|nr:structure-specific endonuclease subunit SLX4 [Denticeps clupeoides]